MKVLVVLTVNTVKKIVIGNLGVIIHQWELLIRSSRCMLSDDSDDSDLANAKNTGRQLARQVTRNRLANVLAQSVHRTKKNGPQWSTEEIANARMPTA
jgi:hypothetical protein